MTNSEPRATSRQPAGRSAARRRRRRQLWLRASGIVVAAGLIVGGLFAAGVIDWPDGSDGNERAAGTDAGAPEDSTTSTNSLVGGPARRALSHDDPLRLWIAGDSLAGSVGPSLGELTAETGVVQPEYDSRVSSGLLNPNFFDWPEHAADQIDLIDPDAVVFLIGTNDASVWDSALAEQYRVRTELTMRLLAQDGRDVYWVGPPVAKADDLEEGVQAVSLIAQNAAEQIDGITYVDAHKLFADSDGNYQQSFENELGVRQVMRAGDGVHFSVDGADLLGREIFRLLDQTWNITDQAEPDRPLQVRETEGSTQVPGTHRSISVQTGSTTPSRSGSSDDEDDDNGSPDTTSTTVATVSTTPTSTSTTTPEPSTTTTTTVPPPPPT